MDQVGVWYEGYHRRQLWGPDPPSERKTPTVVKSTTKSQRLYKIIDYHYAMVGDLGSVAELLTVRQAFHTLSVMQLCTALNAHITTPDNRDA